MQMRSVTEAGSCITAVAVGMKSGRTIRVRAAHLKSVCVRSISGTKTKKKAGNSSKNRKNSASASASTASAGR
jgi:hypothetical protein